MESLGFGEAFFYFKRLYIWAYKFKTLKFYKMNFPKQPKVGDIVLFTCNPNDEIAKSNYNHDPIPAIITRVWGEVCVNIKIIPDCGAMQDRTSVVHFSQNPAGYNWRYNDERDTVSVDTNIDLMKTVSL